MQTGRKPQPPPGDGAPDNSTCQQPGQLPCDSKECVGSATLQGMLNPEPSPAEGSVGKGGGFLGERPGTHGVHSSISGGPG